MLREALTGLATAPEGRDAKGACRHCCARRAIRRVTDLHDQARRTAASKIRSAISSAWEMMPRWLAATSIVLAFMGLAMNRSRSGLIVRCRR